MEVAGVVLGGMSLILWSLENYRTRALDPAKDYWRYESTLKNIHMNIFIQKEQLEVTFRNLGLQNASLPEVELALHRRYPDKCNTFMAVLEHMDRVVQKLMHKLDIDTKVKPKMEEATVDRVEWEWRRVKRSFGKNERQSLIDELQYWNNALKNCIERPEIPSAGGDRTVQELQTRFDQEQCNVIRENARAIHEALQSGWGCACQEPHTGNLHLEWHNDKVLAPAVFELSLSYRKAQNGQSCASNECWQKILIRIEEGAAWLPPPAPAADTPPVMVGNVLTVQGPSPAKKKTFSQFLQFGQTTTKSSSKSNHSASPSQTSLTPEKKFPQQRAATPPHPPISGLCELLQKCTTAAECLGYFPHPKSPQLRRIQIHNPGAKPFLPKPLPISSVISSSNQRVVSRLSLSRKLRFGIAASVAWAVLFLCDSPWLSEKLDNDEIQLLLDDDGGNMQREPAGNTCVSYRFCPPPAAPVSSASPSAIDQFQNFQIRNKTLFALGILLIELCLNRPFAELRQESRIHSQSLGGAETQQRATTATTATTATMIEDYAVAEEQMDKIYLEAGYLFGYAVQRCLRCEFPGRDVTKNFNFQQFRMEYFSGVVAPIQATFDLIPRSCEVF